MSPPAFPNGTPGKSLVNLWSPARVRSTTSATQRPGTLQRSHASHASITFPNSNIPSLGSHPFRLSSHLRHLPRLPSLLFSPQNSDISSWHQLPVSSFRQTVCRPFVFITHSNLTNNNPLPNQRKPTVDIRAITDLQTRTPHSLVVVETRKHRLDSHSSCSAFLVDDTSNSNSPSSRQHINVQ